MRIAFIMEAFPKLSETFILNQVTGLIDQGHEVEIFPSRRILKKIIYSKVKNYGLFGRTFSPPDIPENKLAAKLKCIWFFLKNVGRIEVISPIMSLRTLFSWK